jgi:heme exporter protein D
MQATPHLDFIIAAYVAAVAIVGGITLWVMLDYRAQRRTLAELERRGITRRSAAQRTGETMQELKS